MNHINNPARTKGASDPSITVVCKHCGNVISKVRLRGISLICPLCGKPQNGEPHISVA